LSSSTILLRQGPAVKAGDTEIRSRAARGAEAADVELIRIRINRPLGWPAPEVVVRTNDQSRFLTERSENIFRILNPVVEADDRKLLSEGAFVIVRDSAGKIVATAGYSVRTGMGVGL
jgi:hypothetical protein